MMRCYSELIRIPTFEDRLKYLMTAQHPGDRTFGGDRYLNQQFYQSREWKSIRHKIAVRDNGFDLAFDGYPVGATGVIHHINPISIDNLTHSDDCLFDPENLILCSLRTHNAIHYGNESSIPTPIVERRPGDTCPWR